MKSLLQNQVQQFLASKQPEVLAIKGAWGVGKTFSWDLWLKEAAQKGEVALNNYSYVSLFGLNSLAELKQAIFQNTRAVNKLDTPASLETIKEDPFGFSKAFSRKSSGFFKKLPFIQNYANSIDSIAYFSIRKTIICLDDLERRGDNLTDKDIMGLVNQLKEEKDCKLVLLFNDTKGSFEGYNEFREKVIDKELQFKITSQEACELAFQDLNFYPQAIHQYAQQLAITNIRILHKIKHHALQLEEKLQGCEPSMIKDTLHSLVLFVWCFYNREKNTPTLDFIFSGPSAHLSRQIIDLLDGETSNKKEVTEEEKQVQRQQDKWSELLKGYGFHQPSNLDTLLVEGVKAGYFDHPDWLSLVAEQNKQHKDVEFNQQYKKIWVDYYNKFNTKQKDFVDKIYHFIDDNLDKISNERLNEVVNLFFELEESKKSEELIGNYISYYSDKNHIERFNIHNKPFYTIGVSKILKEALKEHYLSLFEKDSVTDILERIAKEKWQDDDLIILSNLQVSDFKELFVSLNPEDNYIYINSCLRFNNIGNASDEMKDIGRKAEEALKEIAKINEFNRLKIKNIYKLDFEFTNLSEDPI